MSFVSIAFAVLYAVALAVRFGLRNQSGAYVTALLALSWIFYAWHVPAYLGLIVFSTVVDYAAGLWIAAQRARRPGNATRGAQTALAVSLVLNLGLLATFKYGAFVAGQFGEAPAWLRELALPVGISFYTFQSMSYTIDVYRGAIEPQRSFVRFACYVAFFPQLVAGPIVRAGDFFYQLERRRAPHLRVFWTGCYLIVRGFFCKVVIADNVGQFVDAHWHSAAEPGAAPGLAWAMMIFFAFQLLADFAGYTDIARGIAYQLGVRLPINFHAPYSATTFAGFWRRWHITLSQWFRDYAYVPLGGNRRGAVRSYVNLLLVMLIAGLWHGAAWTFVLWGALHGLAIATERALGLARGARNPFLAIVWYVVVQATWVLSMGLFRSSDVQEAGGILRAALSPLVSDPMAVFPGLVGEELALGWWFLLPIVAAQLRVYAREAWGVPPVGRIERAIYGGAMLAAVVMMYPPSQRFLYFQF